MLALIAILGLSISLTVIILFFHPGHNSPHRSELPVPVYARKRRLLNRGRGRLYRSDRLR